MSAQLSWPMCLGSPRVFPGARPHVVRHAPAFGALCRAGKAVVAGAWIGDIGGT